MPDMTVPPARNPTPAVRNGDAPANADKSAFKSAVDRAQQRRDAARASSGTANGPTNPPADPAAVALARGGDSSQDRDESSDSADSEAQQQGSAPVAAAVHAPATTLAGLQSSSRAHVERLATRHGKDTFEQQPSFDGQGAPGAIAASAIGASPAAADAAWVGRVLVADDALQRELRIALAEQSMPVQAVAVRAKDGAISLVISTTASAAPDLQRRLGALRKRLADAGHRVVDIRLVFDTALEDL